MYMKRTFYIDQETNNILENLYLKRLISKDKTPYSTLISEGLYLLANKEKIDGANHGKEKNPSK